MITFERVTVTTSRVRHVPSHTSCKNIKFYRLQNIAYSRMYEICKLLVVARLEWAHTL